MILAEGLKIKNRKDNLEYRIIQVNTYSVLGEREKKIVEISKSDIKRTEEQTYAV